MIADSFLVDEGRVRGLSLHRSRFAGSCGVPLEGFWDEMVASLPRSGRWFPRVSYSGSFSLWLRPAPASLGGSVRVLVHDGPDPRVAPRVKGPDLEVLGELRAAARESCGADEVLLTAGDVVLEGAYSSLLWWESDTLCLPPQDLPVLPSVTVSLLRLVAGRLGVPVEERSRTLGELAGCEAWLVSALHGIRPVSAWLNGPPAGRVHRAPSWQNALLSLSTPLPGAVAGTSHPG